MKLLTDVSFIYGTFFIIWYNRKIVYLLIFDDKTF